jgi:hypothetical protein
MPPSSLENVYISSGPVGSSTIRHCLQAGWWMPDLSAIAGSGITGHYQSLPAIAGH